MERAVVNNRQRDRQVKQRTKPSPAVKTRADDDEDDVNNALKEDGAGVLVSAKRGYPLNGESYESGHFSNSGSSHSGNQVASVQDGTLQPNQCYSPGVMNHMKKKLSNNFEHYSNIFQGIALPVLFRKNRKSSRSRSRSRSKSRDKSRKDKNHNRDHINTPSDDRLSDEDDFVFVENIELRDMDALISGGSREVGRGHSFIALQLRAPTWCDKCGDFIWGVLKQCLKCRSKFKLYFIWLQALTKVGLLALKYILCECLAQFSTVAI